jgi:glutaredoxin
VKLTIYSRPGCHLCDEMKEVVGRVAASSDLPLSIEEIDISTDAELEARYGVEIPVLVIDGRKVAKYRISESALAQLVRAREVG